MTAATSGIDLDRLVGSKRPRIETPTPRGRTLGGDMADLADAIEVPLLPWQGYVANRASVIDSAGRWVCSTCGVVVARQNGKTHLLRCRILTGLYVWDHRLIVATAQNREIALETFRLVCETIEAFPWLSREVVNIRRANGQEAVELRAPASYSSPGRPTTRSRGTRRYRIVAPTPGGARGLAEVDLAVLDEAREHRTVDAYAALTYTTRASTNPQVWLTSNAGDAGSVVLNGLRDQALRAIASPGSDPTVGYWEYSAAPGCALDDPGGWVAANPALGHTIAPATLAAEIARDRHRPDVVRTEALCQWVDTMDSPWPPEAWPGCYVEGTALEAGRPTVLAYDVTPDRRDAALIAVQPDPDGAGFAAVLVDTWHADSAVDELTIAGDVAEVARQLEVTEPIRYDRYTGAAIAARLEAEGFAVADVSGDRFTQACDELLSAMVSRRLRHGGQQTLTEHVTGAARKPAADGGWRIVRASSAGPIPAAVALAMAVTGSIDRAREPVVVFA